MGVSQPYTSDLRTYRSTERSSDASTSHDGPDDNANGCPYIRTNPRNANTHDGSDECSSDQADGDSDERSNRLPDAYLPSSNHGPNGSTDVRDFEREIGASATTTASATTNGIATNCGTD